MDEILAPGRRSADMWLGLLLAMIAVCGVFMLLEVLLEDGIGYLFKRLRLEEGASPAEKFRYCVFLCFLAAAFFFILAQFL